VSLLDSTFSDDSCLFVVLKEDYDKWKNDELLFCGSGICDYPLISQDELIGTLKNDLFFLYEDVDFDNPDELKKVFKEEKVFAHRDFFPAWGYNIIYGTYCLPGDKKVVAFGYYRD